MREGRWDPGRGASPRICIVGEATLHNRVTAIEHRSLTARQVRCTCRGHGDLDLVQIMTSKHHFTRMHSASDLHSLTAYAPINIYLIIPTT